MTKEDLAVLRDIPKRRKIYLQGFISEKRAHRFILQFNEMALSPKPIRLGITSPGGETHSAVQICRTVEAAPGPVYGVVGKKAGSGALMILQACKVRVARRGAQFNIHPNFYRIPFRISAFMNEEENVEEFRNAMKLYKPALEMEWMTLIYPVYHAIERAGRSQEEFLELISKDPVLSPQEALAWGLIDEVIR